jgi:predicted nucleic acid-binding protein
MPVVISDTSPVRALAHLGHLAWLEHLFKEIVLPPAVTMELLNPPSGLQPVDVRACPFLIVQAPSDVARVTQLQLILDAGEAEAIALAEELHADVVLIDELTGRAVARQCGFIVQGTLGILLRAKQDSLCAEVRPLLDRLQQEINFFVSPALRTSILHQAGE